MKLTQALIDSVNRECERAALDAAWQDALQGRRQFVFVSGDPGVGKTTLVETWANALAAGGQDLLYGSGQFLEQEGATEAYLPILDALGRLCRGSHGARLIALLRRHAPNWLNQMPWLIEPAEREALRQELLGSTQNRMLREFAEFLENLTQDTPLLLVLKDLHWSDAATTALLAYLAQREEPARLCVLGILRTDNADGPEHPLTHLRQQLAMRKQCREIALDCFSEQETSRYLQQRLPGGAPPELVTLLYHRTGGHPLFLAEALDDLIAAGVLGEERPQIPLEAVGIRMPADLQQAFAHQLERLSEAEQQVLEAACVSADKFSAAAVAAIMEANVPTVEETCEKLVRRGQWLCKVEGERWPDGTLAEFYRFVHASRRHFLHQGLPAARRRLFHQRLAQRLETAYSNQAKVITADLAYHWEQAGDERRAVECLQAAALVDNARFAPREAIQCLDRAMPLLDRLPADTAQELRCTLLKQRSDSLLAAGQLDQAIAGYQELAKLTRSRNDAAGEVNALLGLANALFWIDRGRCMKTAEHAVLRSIGLEDPLLVAHTTGCHAHWQSIMRGYRQEHVAAYLTAVAEARKAGDKYLECQHLARYAYLLSLRSQYDATCKTAEAGLELAKEIGDGHHYFLCQFFRAWGLFYGGRWGEMAAVMGETQNLAERNGNAPWAAHFRLQQAWLLDYVFDYQGLRGLCEPVLSLARARPPGSEYFLSLILLTRACLGERQLDKAGSCLDEIASPLKETPNLIDWVLRLPLQLTVSEYCRARGAWQQARGAAEILLNLAAGPMERTYYTLALMLLTDIATAQKNSAEAANALSKLKKSLEDGYAPVAAWRAYAVAARAHEMLGQKVEAERCWHFSAVAINRLAESMALKSPLRASFITHPQIRDILARAAED